MNRKDQLIEDIQKLLNSYEGVKETEINPNLLAFMDEETLINIIDSLLTQKENAVDSDTQWLEKFKKYKQMETFH